MRRRRAIIVGLSAVLGVLAGAIAYTYLSGVQSRAYHNATLTSVYVASRAIPKGMSGQAALSAGLIRQEEMPLQFRPVGAVSDPKLIASGVALDEIPSQQVIVSTLFGQLSSTGGVAAQAIPPGDVAISISVDAVHGVAGLIQPGDEVDLLVSLSGPKEATLYQDVPVLATGTDLGAASQSGSASVTSAGSTSVAPSSGLITFAVPLKAAERIAMASSGQGGVSGSIYLALVPPGSSASQVAPIGAGNLLPSTPTPK